MKRFDIDATAVILIDHQVGTNTWAATTPLDLLKRNVIILAKFATGTGMPLVLTSSQETNVNVQGPLMPELAAIAPKAFDARIKRTGVVNAWDDPAFAEACRATGKRNLVMAGVTTDVCMVEPAISALDEGFNVQVAAMPAARLTKSLKRCPDDAWNARAFASRAPMRSLPNWSRTGLPPLARSLSRR